MRWIYARRSRSFDQPRDRRGSLSSGKDAGDILVRRVPPDARTLSGEFLLRPDGSDGQTSVLSLTDLNIKRPYQEAPVQGFCLSPQNV